MPAAPVVQRILACGGWVIGRRRVRRPRIRPATRVITYYQKKRHIFGDLKIEVLDADGKLLDTLPTSKRRGLNRVPPGPCA